MYWFVPEGEAFRGKEFMRFDSFNKGMNIILSNQQTTAEVLSPNKCIVCSEQPLQMEKIFEIRLDKMKESSGTGSLVCNAADFNTCFAIYGSVFTW